MTTRLHQKDGLRPPCLNPGTGGILIVGMWNTVYTRMLSAPPRYDVKPARFALKPGQQKALQGMCYLPWFNPLRWSGTNLHYKGNRLFSDVQLIFFIG